MSSSGKSMRLHFKGDKPEKKKKKRSCSDKDGGGASTSKGKKREEDGVSDVDEVGGDEQAWVPARHPTDLSGPIVIYQEYSPSSSSASDPSSSKKFYAITLNPTLQKMSLTALTPPEPLSAQLSAQDKAELEGAQIVDASSLAASSSSGGAEGLPPTEVHQVLVASRVLDTADPPRYTLRTTEHRFLGADKHGTLLCGAEARGPQEEWSLLSASSGSESEPGAESSPTTGLAFRSMHGTYLCLDEVAGGKLVLRVDSSSVGAAETWSASVQWKFRHQARQGERAREIGKGKGEEGLSKRLKLETGGAIDEKSLMKSRQSYTLGRTPLYSSGDDHADRKALKRAIKEGRAAEELLDRRSKMKSDKFA